MAGSWERVGGGSRFRPRFAPATGAVLVIVGRQDPHRDWVEHARIVVPGRRPVSETVVVSIDPGSDEVPANLLRIAVLFSSPIEEGTAAGRISLLDSAGADLPGTLLPMPPELWDRERRRLTVLLEPGRIKRGLQPNAQAGAPLREGETFAVVVDSGIRDSSGAELVAGARRGYRVGPAIRSRVDPRRWAVRWPEGGRDSLVARFDRPLDRALVGRCLRVLDEHGEAIPGRASLDDGARAWTFVPSVAGRGGGSWRLQVDTRLEDLAGNSVRRVFDRDLLDSGDDGIDAAFVVLAHDHGDLQTLI